MNKQTDYYSPTEEIDLTGLLRKLIQFLRINLKLILLFVLTGVLLGVANYYLLPRKYNVQMIADSRLLSSQEVVEIMDPWNDLIANGEYALLSRKTHVPGEVLADVASLEATSAGNSAGGSDKDAFTVQAVVLSNTRLDTLQKGIIRYLEQSPYVQERVNAEKRRLTALRNRVDREISQLDSVKLSLQNLISRGGGSSNAFIAEPGNINVDIVELYEQSLKIEESLQFIDNIQVISGFDRRENPDSPKMTICIAIGAAVGLIAALMVAFLRALNL